MNSLPYLVIEEVTEDSYGYWIATGMWSSGLRGGWSIDKDQWRALAGTDKPVPGDVIVGSTLEEVSVRLLKNKLRYLGVKMEWTQELPTEKGYYHFWYIEEDGKPRQQIVRVAQYRRQGVSGSCYLFYLHAEEDALPWQLEDAPDDAWWMGPIELPVPPQLPERTDIQEET